MRTSCESSDRIQSRIIRELDAAPDTVKPWNDFEMDMLRRYYLLKGSRAIAKALGRTISSVHNQAQRIGIIRTKTK
jgi:hypothetical protein